MLKRPAENIRRLFSVLAIAGFVMAPAWLVGVSNSAEAAPSEYRLMEGYEPPVLGGNAGLELGVKASSSQEGYITEVFFYKYESDDGGHAAHIWAENGVLIGSQPFIEKSASGWQSVRLDDPVKIVENQTFVVSVYGSNYFYAGGQFPARTSGPLTVIDSLYRYSDRSGFPSQTVGTNYAVDFTFTSELPAQSTIPNPGLRVDVYSTRGQSPEPKPNYVLCSTQNVNAWTSVESIDHEFDRDFQGIVAGCDYDEVLVHYSGYLTWPRTEKVTLRAIADDGFYMTLDGQLVIDDWNYKPCSGPIVERDFIANKPQKLDAWFFEGGGGACSTLTAVQNGEFLPIPKEAFTKNAFPTGWSLGPVAASKPLNVSSSVSGIDISVSWDAPVDDGGSPISGYQVTAVSADETFSCDALAVETFCELVGMLAGRDYLISVIAFSDSGKLSSLPSDPITQSIGIGVLTPTVTAPSASPINYLQRLSESVLSGGSSSVPGRFTFVNPESEPQSGLAAAQVIFTPVDQITYRSVNLSVDVTVNKLSRSVLWPSGPDATWTFGSSLSAPASISRGDGSVTYSVLGSSERCLVNAQTGLLETIRSGECVLQASVTETPNYLASVNQKTLNIIPIAASSPLSVQTSLEENVATISWAAPLADGGSDISGYQVRLTSDTDTKTCLTGPLNLTCTIDDLSPGSIYAVEVLALSNENQLTSSPGSAELAIPELPLEEVVPEPVPENLPVEEEPYVDLRPFEAINPLVEDPVGVAQKTVAAITLVSAVAAAGAAVAGAAGAASAAGGAASSGGSSSSSSSGSSSRADAKTADSQNKNESNSVGEEASDIRDLTRGKIGDDQQFGQSGKWGDLLGLWALPLLLIFDKPSKKLATSLARVLPLGSKIFADGAYLRAMLGSLSLLLVLAAVVAGLVGASQVGGLLLLPSVIILAIIVFIGTLDVLAGFFGAAALAVGLAVAAGINTPADIRFLFGVVALGIVPRVISGAFRALRRQVSSNFSYIWERLLDYMVAPMLSAWATFQIVQLLPVFAGIALPVDDLSVVLPVLVAFGMILRITLEEISGRYFPDRIKYVQIEDLPKPPLAQVIISIVLKAATFAFIAISLIGVSWHLFVGAFLFVLPNFLTLVQDKLPNSTKLYHLMPQGLVNLSLSLWLGQVTLVFMTSVFQETPDLAQLGFVLLPIPSLLISILKLFGRHGVEGEPRFYERPNMFWFYRLGTLVMVFVTAELTSIVNTTSLF